MHYSVSTYIINKSVYKFAANKSLFNNTLLSEDEFLLLGQFLAN